MAITIRELAVKLGLDTNAQSFVKGQLAVDGIRFALGAVVERAREASAALVASFNDTLQAAGGMDAAAASVSLTTDRFQRLTEAAEVWGVTQGQLSAALGKFRGSAGGADNALLQLADHVAAAKDPAKQAALAVAELGESGRALVPFLAQGSREIERLASTSTALTAEQIRAATQLAQAQTVLNSLTRQFWRGVIGPLLPLLNRVVQRFLDWKRVNEEIARGQLSAVMERVVSGLEAAGRALEYVWGIILRVKESLTFIGRMLYDKIAAGFRYVYEKAKQAFGYLSTQFEKIRAYATGEGGIKAGIAGLVALFVALGAAGTESALATAAAWAITALKFTAIAAALGAIYLAFDDVATYEESIRRGGTGKNTLYGKWKNQIDGMIGQAREFVAAWLKPNAEDPWWLKAVKELTAYLTKALGIAEKLDLIHPGAGAGLPRGNVSAAATGGRVAAQGAAGLATRILTFGGYGEADLEKIGPYRRFWERQRAGEEAGGGLWDSIKSGIGFSSAPRTSDLGGAGVLAPVTVNNQFSITQLAGESGEDLARRIAGIVEEQRQSEYSAAAAALPAVQ